MNDRIKELIKQCWVQVPYYPAGNDGHPEYNTQFSQEKFAELIVRECAKVADDGFASSNFGNGITGDQLKKHFGVEQ